MEVIFLDGGLGNQMSQYALYMRKKHEGADVRIAFRDAKVHNGYELDRLFNVKRPSKLWNLFFLIIVHIYYNPSHNGLFNILKCILVKLNIHAVSEKYHYGYNPEIIKNSTALVNIIGGGWHHWKYMDCIKEEVKRKYAFPEFCNKKNLELLRNIDFDRAVAIHIRRGDYMDKYNYEKFGSVCTKDYYIKAIELMSKQIENPVFYIFSNDMQWATDVLKDKQYVCVDWNRDTSSWEDMALMSKFKNIIMANSTFSWWAAWLGQEEKNVICPPFLVNNDYSSDIFPSKWHHLS